MTPAGSAAPFKLLALDAQKPNEVTLRPGANCAAQDAGVTVTAVPDRTKLPFQDWVTVTEVGKLNLKVQPLIS